MESSGDASKVDVPAGKPESGDSNPAMPPEEPNKSGAKDEGNDVTPDKGVEGKRKRPGRPPKSEDSTSGSLVMKKKKQDRKTTKPVTRKNNNIEAEMNNQANNFTNLYKRCDTEKCIFCSDQHLREFTWESLGKKKVQKMMPICRECYRCIKS